MPSMSENRVGAGSALADAIAVFAVALSATGQTISMATLVFAGPLTNLDERFHGTDAEHR